tara:strand:- start:261 stop:479 length:219 start_codon:yes stop_codon:yes gene_type:complete
MKILNNKRYGDLTSTLIQNDIVYNNKNYTTLYTFSEKIGSKFYIQSNNDWRLINNEDEDEIKIQELLIGKYS